MLPVTDTTLQIADIKIIFSEIYRVPVNYTLNMAHHLRLRSI